jgi:hypothetical protein
MSLPSSLSSTRKPRSDPLHLRHCNLERSVRTLQTPSTNSASTTAARKVLPNRKVSLRLERLRELLTPVHQIGHVRELQVEVTGCETAASLEHVHDPVAIGRGIAWPGTIEG